MHWMYAAILSMSVTMLLIPLLIRHASRLGLMDTPDVRKVHTKPIPRAGGIAMGVSVLLALFFWASPSAYMWAYFGSLAVILAFGIQDDRLNLSPVWKFFGQGLATLIIMFIGGLMIRWFFTGEDHQIFVWISVPLTLLTIIGFTNAINLSDGLDGLAGGMSVMCLVGVLLMALSSHNAEISIMSAASLGAVVGFLRFNTHPAQIFMGDAGSQLLGFSIAILAISLTQHIDVPYSAAMPLLLLGVPVIDTLLVMIRRIIAGKSPFKADRTHFHHRLMSFGFLHHEAVMVIYIIQVFFMVLAWFFRYTSDLIVVFTFLALMTFIAALFYMLEARGWKLRNDLTVDRRSNIYEWLASGKSFEKLISFGIGGCLALYALLLIINGLSPPSDVRLLAIFLTIVFVVAMIIRSVAPVQSELVKRGVLYTIVMAAVWLDVPNFISGELRIFIEGLIFTTLALFVGARIFLGRDRQFQLSTMDVLVLLVAVVLPNLPGSVISAHTQGWVVAKAILLLYAIETISFNLRIARYLRNGTVFLFLAAIIFSS